MNRSFRQIFCCLVAMALCSLSSSMAQVAVTMGPAGSCSGSSDCNDQQAGMTTQVALSGVPQIGVVSTGGAFAMQEQVDVVKGQPYQAQAITEMKQSLADGSHIVQTNTATVARDSDGRTVRIQQLSTIGPWKSSSDSSQGKGPTVTSIFDPVAKTHIDYTSDTKIAHVLALPPTPPSGASTGMARGFAVAASGPVTAGPGVNVMFAEQPRTVLSNADSDANMKTEPLGTKTIEGLQAEGTRNTSTIPAGTIGNDKDIVITHETWYSPDLKLVLLSTQNDPRFGQTTYSLTNIQRSEPDAALFEVPAGYKIDKVPVMVQTR